MSTVIIYGALMALAMAMAGAAEDIGSANYMLPGCKAFLITGRYDTPESAFDQGKCVGSIRTLAFLGENSDVAINAFTARGQSRGVREHWRCLDIPEGVNNGQMVRVVVRYIEARPYRMHEPFLPLALEALFDAWPCRN